MLLGLLEDPHSEFPAAGGRCKSAALGATCSSVRWPVLSAAQLGLVFFAAWAWKPGQSFFLSSGTVWLCAVV